MKKTLAAVAILGAFAGTAMADVTIYGRIDTGFQYERNGLSGAADKDKFSMVSGQHTGSRIGVKASENINGLQIGFILENGYSSTTGAAGQGGRLFGREASLFLGGDWGKFVFGRMSPVTADAGSVSLYGGVLNAFDFGRGLVATGADSDIVNVFYRNNNSISYVSPVYAGFKFGATYVAGDDNGAAQFSAGNDRLLAAAGVYSAGNVTAGMFVNFVNVASEGDDPDDAWDVTVGGNYNFGFMKAYASVGYFKHSPVGSLDFADCKGFKVSVSADAPVAGGTLMGGFDYTDGEVEGTKIDYVGWAAGAKYTYKPAKSTLFYVGGGYRYEKVKFDGEKEDLTKKFTLGAGAVYYF